ncbi:MAG: hypothetical protein Ct9H90mP13_08260 [Pseudomonadota bacterium]|nr:MAG: hypothetical protein Ct9H90mP13_08260 [Pseudomonadota bacterium]
MEIRKQNSPKNFFIYGPGMQEVVNRGINNEGILPGGLNVERRSNKLYLKLTEKSDKKPDDPLTILDWVTLYALATNEENAAGVQW